MKKYLKEGKELKFKCIVPPKDFSYWRTNEERVEIPYLQLNCSTEIRVERNVVLNHLKNPSLLEVNLNG